MRRQLISLLVLSVSLIGAPAFAADGVLLLQPNGANKPWGGVGNVGKIGGAASAASPTLTEGDGAALSFDLASRLRTTIPCISGESVCTDDGSYLRVGAGAVKATTVASAVTTNTTSATFTLPQGAKTPVVISTAAGAQAFVWTLYGAGDSTAANGIPLCVVTISVSTKDVKTCDSGSQVTKDFPFYYYATTGATGSPSAGMIVYNGLVASSGSGGAGDASAANQTTMITALQLIDDIVGVEDAAETAGAGLARAGTVRRDVPSSSAGTTGDNATLNTNALGAVWVAHIDPCSSLAKIYVPISQATGTQLLTGTASNRTYVCNVTVMSATAQNIALVSGTGTVCATSTAAMIGGTSAATGWNFAANGGIVLGDGGFSIAKSSVDAHNVCLLMSSTGQVSGVLGYVVAPN